MFRGHEQARIDDKGRLKVPNVFRSFLDTKYGRELFLTSVTGEYLRLYPMPVWLEKEEKLGSLADRLFATGELSKSVMDRLSSFFGKFKGTFYTAHREAEKAAGATSDKSKTNPKSK